MKLFLKHKKDIFKKISSNYLQNGRLFKNGASNTFSLYSKIRRSGRLENINKTHFYFPTSIKMGIYREYSTDENKPEEEDHPESEYDRKLKAKNERLKKRREEFENMMKKKKEEEERNEEDVIENQINSKLEENMKQYENEEKQKKIKVEFDPHLLISYLKKDSQINRLLEILLEKLSKMGEVSREDLKQLGFPPFIESAEEALIWTREAEERKQLWYLFLSVMMDVKRNDPTWRDQVWVLLDSAKTEEEKKLWSEIYHLEKRFEDITIPLGSVLRNTLTSVIKASIRSKKRLEDFQFYSDYLKEKSFSLMSHHAKDFFEFIEEPIDKRKWFRHQQNLNDLLKKNVAYFDLTSYYPEDSPRLTRDPLTVKAELDEVIGSIRKNIGNKAKQKELRLRKNNLRSEYKEIKIARLKNKLGVPHLNFNFISRTGILMRIYKTLFKNYIGFMILLLFLFPFLAVGMQIYKESSSLYSSERIEEEMYDIWLSKLTNWIVDAISKDSVFLHNMGKVYYNKEEAIFADVDNFYSFFIPLHGDERTATATVKLDKVLDRKTGRISVLIKSIFVDFSDSTTYFLKVPEDLVFNFDDWMHLKKEITSNESYHNPFYNENANFEHGFGAPPRRFNDSTLTSSKNPKIVYDQELETHFYPFRFSPHQLELTPERFNQIVGFLKKKNLPFLKLESMNDQQWKRITMLFELYDSAGSLDLLFQINSLNFQNLMDPDLSDNDVIHFLENPQLKAHQQETYNHIYQSRYDPFFSYLPRELAFFDQIPFPLFRFFPENEYIAPKSREELAERLSFDSEEPPNFVLLRDEHKELTWRKSRNYINSISRHDLVSLPPAYSDSVVEDFFDSHLIYDKSNLLLKNPLFLPFFSEIERQRVLSDLNGEVQTLYPYPNSIQFNEDYKPNFIDQIFPSRFTDESDNLVVQNDFDIVNSPQVDEILELRNIVEEEMSYDPSLKNAVNFHLQKYLKNRKYPSDFQPPRYLNTNESTGFYFLRPFQTDPKNESVDKPTDFFP